jgi:trehalose synthase
VTGLLVASIEDTAHRIVELLDAPQRMRALGAAGRLHVQREFLITRNLGRWLGLFAQLTADTAPAPTCAATV